MRWIKGRLGGNARRSASIFFTLTRRSLPSPKKTLVLFLTGVLLLPAFAAEEKHVSVYSPVAIYALPVIERSGHEYVGLLELLEPMGRVSSESNGRLLRLRYNSVDAEFTAGKTRARIHGRDIDLPAPFLIENSRGLVPSSSLNTLLPRFLGTPVEYREGGRRLFTGGVGIQTSFRIEAGTSSRVIVSFSGPVNPTISTEPGKLRMIFTRDPVSSPGSQSIAFDSKIITHASYSENNGSAEIDITGNEPLMASISSDRRTITVSAIPQPTANSPSAPSPGVSTGNATSPAAQNSSSLTIAPAANNTNDGDKNGSSKVVARRVLIVVDPAHGGEERGAALTDKLAEKDITLGFARLLRHELESRGFAALLLRDGDGTLTLDQRAAAANGSHAAIYISLHAESQGNGTRVYTALLPVEGTNKGIFHSWNSAQATTLPVSRIVSAAIVTEMQRREFPARVSTASLRPLNNVSMPAVAVELAPGANGIEDLISANYQQRAAAAIADAVVAVRDRLGVDH
jgi:N-acetylmuramoyl-L-alanine amidase